MGLTNLEGTDNDTLDHETAENESTEIVKIGKKKDDCSIII